METRRAVRPVSSAKMKSPTRRVQACRQVTSPPLPPLRVAGIVDLAIQFNGYLRFRAVEVRDIMWTERMLATEFQSGEAAGAETLPELVLGFGGVSAKFAGEFDEARIEAAEGAVHVGVGWKERLGLRGRDLSSWPPPHRMGRGKRGGVKRCASPVLSPCPLSIGWRGGEGVRLSGHPSNLCPVLPLSAVWRGGWGVRLERHQKPMVRRTPHYRLGVFQPQAEQRANVRTGLPAEHPAQTARVCPDTLTRAHRLDGPPAPLGFHPRARPETRRV